MKFIKNIKIRVGIYHSQFGLGVWYTFANGIKYLVFDFGLFWIEIVFKDRGEVYW